MSDESIPAEYENLTPSTPETTSSIKPHLGKTAMNQLDDNFIQEPEDPLIGDVDRWVHPDETRSDANIERDEALKNRLHMSGADGADEYWADYDEYFGTVNGGEEPQEYEPTPTSKDEEVVKNVELADTPGTPEWHAAHTKTVTDIDGNKHNYFDLGPMFKGMSDTEIAAYMRASVMKQKADAKSRAYWDELEELDREGVTEDPLAGDVDRWVHPDETS